MWLTAGRADSGEGSPLTLEIDGPSSERGRPCNGKSTLSIDSDHALVSASCLQEARSSYLMCSEPVCLLLFIVLSNPIQEERHTAQHSS